MTTASDPQIVPREPGDQGVASALESVLSDICEHE